VPDSGPSSRRATRDDQSTRPSRHAAIALALYALLATIITAQQTLGHAPSNNFAIFRASFGHLRRGQDLYAWYLAEHWDLFKYPPSCAALFAPFALVPYGVGLFGWNLLNAMVLCGAVVLLLPGRAALAAMLIVLLEAVGSLQNTQSNALLAGLMILPLVAIEREHVAGGALSVVLGATIKVFPASAGLLGLLTPLRWRHVAWCVGLGAVSLALPLLFTSPDTLVQQYHSWLAISKSDNTKIGMAWLGGLFELALGRAVPHAPIQGLGVAWILFTAWLVRSHWTDVALRRLLLASLLIFSVVFNHMAESPSFVIAYAGVGIWWAALPRERWRDALVLLILLAGSVGGSDIVPKHIRIEWHDRIQLKAIVTLLGWAGVQYDLLRRVRSAVTLPRVVPAPLAQ
jgi:hypothetical protein